MWKFPLYFSVDRYLCWFCWVPPYLNSIFRVFFFLMILSNEHFTRLLIYIMTHFSLIFYSIFIYIFKLHATTKYLRCYSYMIKKDGANNFWIFCSAILRLSLHFFIFRLFRSDSVENGDYSFCIENKFSNPFS